MPIKFRCPCGKVYQVSEEFAGKKIACQSCGKHLRVPGGETAVAAPPAATAKKGKPQASGKKGGAAALQKPAPPPSDEDLDFDFEEPVAPLPKKGVAAPPLVTGKKKRRKAAAEETAPVAGGQKKIALIAGLSLFGLLGLGGLGYVISRAVGASVAANTVEMPQNFVRFKSEHGGFSVEHPEGWTVESGGGTGGVPPWVRFGDSKATVAVKASLSGTAISDIAGAFNQGEEIPDDMTPTAQAHDFQKMKVELDYNDYEETPATTLQVPFGEVRQSEFTAKEGLLSTVKGLRATFITTQFQFNVICKCREQQFESYRPIFEKAINSIDR